MSKNAKLKNSAACTLLPRPYITSALRLLKSKRLVFALVNDDNSLSKAQKNKHMEEQVSNIYSLNVWKLSLLTAKSKYEEPHKRLHSSSQKAGLRLEKEKNLLSYRIKFLKLNFTSIAVLRPPLGDGYFGLCIINSSGAPSIAARGHKRQLRNVFPKDGKAYGEGGGPCKSQLKFPLNSKEINSSMASVLCVFPHFLYRWLYRCAWSGPGL